MKNNGFTLIELLAVIIILAVLALIATPIVLNVVDDAKKSAAQSEANMIVSGIQNGCATREMQSQMEGSTVTACALSLDSTAIGALVNLGNATVTGSATLNASNKVTAITIVSNGHTLIMSGSTMVFSD